MDAKKPLFRDLAGDDPDPEVTEVESMCVSCGGNGKTRLLLTKIPFYKDVILMSFICDECGYQNNELQSGAVISERGVRITLSVVDVKDLNRQLVKSDYTSLKIPELDFEIPLKSQTGEVTTVEGILDRCITGLQQDQPARVIEHPEVARQIDSFVDQLRELKNVKSPFTLVLEDISGNSFIENPRAPDEDPQCVTKYFKRTKEQDHELGIFTPKEVSDETEVEETSVLHPVGDGDFTLEDIEGEVMQFSTNCPSCGSPTKTNMKATNIPHFKEIIIMAMTCEVCGYKTNEVKSGTGIEPKGVRIEVEVKTKEDFSRDVLKSETCDLKIPELDLKVGPYALAGRFTTIEGLIIAVKEQLSDPNYSHIFGDSEDTLTKEKFQHFLKKFDAILENKIPVTISLDDPAGNSYIQSMADGNELDKRLRITHYERNFEQNEELGLNDMKTENYEIGDK
ncbi:zinc finger protein ZPR1 [Cylas formicarius]|uniref:zinc finger protein ZPR1 n=1 Tax=Cylas formicarius TaxID=197179 RepID=UPI002958B676|nr:zinc finger protein ZPR1 [Cylas formicarius]